MRQRNRIVLDEARGATHRRTTTPPDLDSAWNAAISINQQLFKHATTTYNQLSGSHTPSNNLCMTVSARRLSEN